MTFTNAKIVRTMLLVGLLWLPAPSLSAAQLPAVTLSLQYRQAKIKSDPGKDGLFGKYLGTGDGVVAGAIEGRVEWDLYEDQSKDDFHPAHFRGTIHHDGRIHSFQIFGVYTPVGTEMASTPSGHETFRHWSLSGTIAFDDDELLGVRHTPITGLVDTSVGQVQHRVWLIEPR